LYRKMRKSYISVHLSVKKTC